MEPILNTYWMTLVTTADKIYRVYYVPCIMLRYVFSHSIFTTPLWGKLLTPFNGLEITKAI